MPVYPLVKVVVVTGYAAAAAYQPALVGKDRWVHVIPSVDEAAIDVL